jgi:hypothetical protein
MFVPTKPFLLSHSLDNRAKVLAPGQFFAVKVSRVSNTIVIEDLAEQKLNDTKLALFTSAAQRAELKAYMESKKGTLFADRFRRRRCCSTRC